MQTMNGPSAGRICLRVQVRTSHTVREQRVTRKDRSVVQDIRRALIRVAWRVNRAERRVAKSNLLTICDGGKREARTILRR